MQRCEMTARADEAAESGWDLASVMLQAMQESPAPMMLTDTQGIIKRVNTAFESATGYASAELRGRHPSLLKSGLQGRGFYRSMWARLARTGRWQGEIWNRRKDGQLFQERLTIVALRGPDGSAAYYLGTYAAHAARPAGGRGGGHPGGATDAVTGLLSRHGFASAVDRMSGQHGLVHVLALDIDGFTELNELHGLEAGDAVLRQMGLRCTQVAAATCRSAVVARVGPDEFAIGLVAAFGPCDDPTATAWVQDVATRLYAATALPFDMGEGLRLNVSVSIGLASLLRGGCSATEALLHASVARQQAVPGVAALQRYEAQDGQRRLALALREAIRLDQIEVAFQPKVDLATGRLAGAEVLARWTLPDGVCIPPSEFIPLAEQRGLIGLVGDRVMERALAQIGAWQAAGLRAPVVAVNFSALQFHRDNPAQHLALAMDRHRVAPERIELELTESLLIGDIDTVMQSLRAFRDLGVALSIDDFGTGYSSLAYLRRFPLHCLKIDRQFVSGMTLDPSAHEIVRLIVEMAHRLNLRCIAEGIETTAQLRMLRDMGCDEGQGFLLARPMKGPAMDRLLQGDLPWAGLFETVADASPTVDEHQAGPPAPGRNSAPRHRVEAGGDLPAPGGSKEGSVLWATG